MEPDSITLNSLIARKLTETRARYNVEHKCQLETSRSVDVKLNFIGMAFPEIARESINL